MLCHALKGGLCRGKLGKQKLVSCLKCELASVSIRVACKVFVCVRKSRSVNGLRELSYCEMMHDFSTVLSISQNMS